MFDTLLYILIGLLALMFMITVHEFGHYVVGKRLGFKIVEFSIGFGPKIFQKQRKDGELFSIRMIPLGGYCQFYGEDDQQGLETGSFNSMHPFKRILVLISGALFNFISAILIVIISFSAYGDHLPYVHEYSEDSPQLISESTESLHLNDVIYEINGTKVYFTNDLETEMSKLTEENGVIDLVVIRNNEKVSIKAPYEYRSIEVTDSKGNVSYVRKPILGILMGYTQVRFSFVDALTRSVPYCLRAGGLILKSLGQLITGVIGIESLGGPITTIGLTVQAVKSGFSTMLYFITIVSVNLAVFNLLPIPALDGSKVIFCLIEWVRGKPINRKIENAIHTIGLIAVFAFAIIIDVMKLF